MRQIEPLLNVRFDAVGVDTALDQLFKAAKKPWRLDGLTRKDIAGTVTLPLQRQRLSDAVKKVLEFAKTPTVLKIVDGEYVVVPGTPKPAALAERPTPVPPAPVGPVTPPTTPAPPRLTGPLPEMVVQTGHTKTILRLAFSPDGTRLLSVGADGTRLWDITSGLLERFLPGAEWGFTGDALVYTASGKRIDFLALDSGSAPNAINLPQSPHIEISTNRERVAYGGMNMVDIVDRTTRAKIHLGQPDRFAIEHFTSPSFRFAAGDDILVFVMQLPPDRAIGGYEAHTGRRIWAYPFATSIPVWVVSPDGRYVVACTDGRPRLIRIDARTGAAQTFPVSGIRRSPTSLAIFPDNRHVAAALEAHIAIYRLSDGALVRTLPGANASAIALSPDGRSMAIASGARIRLVRATDGFGYFHQPVQGHPATVLAFRGDGELWVGQGLRIARWKPGSTAVSSTAVRASWTQDQTLPKVQSGPFRSLLQESSYQRLLDLSPVRALYAARAAQGSTKSISFGLVVGRSGDGQPLRHIPAHELQVASARFSPDGSRLALGGSRAFASQNGFTARVTILTTGNLKAERTIAIADVLSQKYRYCGCRDVQWSGDGRYLAVKWSLLMPSPSDRGAAQYREVTSIHATGSYRVQRIIEHYSGNYYGFREKTASYLSHDGRTLVGERVLTIAQPEIVAWNTASGAAKSLGIRPRPLLSACAFRPDDRAVAVASGTGVIELFELPEGRKFGEMRGHGDRINALAFRGDGEVLASASDDGSVRLWKVPRL